MNLIGKTGIFQASVESPTFSIRDVASPTYGIATLQPEYYLFSPAALYLYAGLTDDMLARFVAGHPNNANLKWPLSLFKIVNTSRPLFGELEDPNNWSKYWNHVVFAVDKQYRESVRMGVMSASLADHATMDVRLTGIQSMYTIDSTDRVFLVDLFTFAGKDYGLKFEQTAAYPKAVPTLGAPEAAAAALNFYGGHGTALVSSVIQEDEPREELPFPEIKTDPVRPVVPDWIKAHGEGTGPVEGVFGTYKSGESTAKGNLADRAGS